MYTSSVTVCLYKEKEARSTQALTKWEEAACANIDGDSIVASLRIKGCSLGMEVEKGLRVCLCCASEALSLLADSVEDEFELSTVCHRPEGLDQLQEQTKFTRKELQVLYRGFKNVS